MSRLIFRRFVVSCLAVAVALIGASAADAQSLTDRTDKGVAIVPYVGGAEGDECPVDINGTLGSGSPDWPFTTGLQTGRLNRNGISSTCAVPKVCDIFLTDPGRAYDAYAFTNSTGATACVESTLTVVTQTDCNLQINAYLNSYDPANICDDYLADPGLSSGVPPTPVMFSFDVPNGDTLILVVHTTNPGEIGCEYILSMSGECIPVELQSLTIE